MASCPHFAEIFPRTFLSKFKFDAIPFLLSKMAGFFPNVPPKITFSLHSKIDFPKNEERLGVFLLRKITDFSFLAKASQKLGRRPQFQTKGSFGYEKKPFFHHKGKPLRSSLFKPKGQIHYRKPTKGFLRIPPFPHLGTTTFLTPRPRGPWGPLWAKKTINEWKFFEPGFFKGEKLTAKTWKEKLKEKTRAANKKRDQPPQFVKTGFFLKFGALENFCSTELS